MILLDQAGAGAQGARFFRPSAAHAPWAEYSWTQQVGSAPTGRTWRIIPDLNPYLIFAIVHAGSRLQARCSIVGPRSVFTDVAMDNRVMTYGVCLRPDALPHLTRLPSSDFTDRSLSIDAVFGARGRSLTERLGEEAAGQRIFDTLTDFLAQEWRGPDRHASLPLEGCDRVEQLAARMGMPIRTLYSRLTQETGLSPKRMLRIRRLHRALRLAQGGAAWPQIAANSGFADQAHMIREFTGLLGESPTAWRQRSDLPISSIRAATPPNTLSECRPS